MDVGNQNNSLLIDETALFDDSKSYKTRIDITKWNMIRSGVWFFNCLLH